MADNMDIVYKREVSRITLQESYRLPKPVKIKSEKRIIEETDKYPHASSYLKDGTSKLYHTDKSSTFKRNLRIERNSNKVEYTCDVCGIVCTGIDNFKLHIEGKKHNKRLKELKIQQQTGHISPQIPNTFNCNICEGKFTSLETYLHTCKGCTHQEIVYGLTKTKKLDDPSPFSQGARCTESAPTHCDACKIWFKSPIAYDLHIETREHYRKRQNLEELVVMQDVILASEGHRVTCETCGKAFNGSIPYKQHLMSNSHSKKGDITKEMMRMDIIQSTEMYCKDCGKKFSGIVPLSDHLKGSSHKRQIKKNYMLKNLEKDHPEVLNYSMFGIQGEDAKSDGDVKLHCETCHLEFNKTGEVQEHFTGFKHREVTKEKVQVKKLQELTKRRESMVEENAAILSESDDSSDDSLIEL